MKESSEQLPEHRPKVYLRFGQIGHEGEYTVNFDDMGVRDMIPRKIVGDLQETLGSDWRVDNRGTRLEIIHAHKYGKRDDRLIMDALEKATKETHVLDI